MKNFTRILLSFLLVFTILSTRGNPIIWEPIQISELHFDLSGNWTMELNVVQDPMINGDSTLDNFGVISKAGFAQFNPGIPIHLGNIILVTKSDFQTPLIINQTDEILQVEEYMGSEWEPFALQLIIGETMPFSVPPVLNGQSVHLLSFNMYQNYYVKSNTSTLGQLTYINTLCRSHLNGHIYDASLNPVPAGAVKVNYYPQLPDLLMNGIPTDNEGFFSMELYACNNDISFKDATSTHTFKTVLLPAEPDSTHTMDVFLDTLLAGISSLPDGMKCYLSINPNPFTVNTTICVSSPSRLTQPAIIKIYNEQGEIVGILPLTKTSGSNDQLSVPLNIDKYNLNPGLYFLSFEVNGTSLASNKMVIIQ